MTKFTAVAEDGTVFKRSSVNRNYTHTVIFKRSIDRDRSNATDKVWPKQNARDYDYYSKIASGNDPYPRKCWRTVEKGWTVEQVADEAIAVAAENDRRKRDAIAKIAGMTCAQYVEREQFHRLASIANNDEGGYYNVWHNAGWCGRYDLAQKLAGQMIAKGFCEVTILEAQAAR